MACCRRPVKIVPGRTEGLAAVGGGPVFALGADLRLNVGPAWGGRWSGGGRRRGFAPLRTSPRTSPQDIYAQWMEAGGCCAFCFAVQIDSRTPIPGAGIPWVPRSRYGVVL